jgi:hypothetical protein
MNSDSVYNQQHHGRIISAHPWVASEVVILCNPCGLGRGCSHVERGSGSAKSRVDSPSSAPSVDSAARGPQYLAMEVCVSA